MAVLHLEGTTLRALRFAAEVSKPHLVLLCDTAASEGNRIAHSLEAINGSLGQMLGLAEANLKGQSKTQEDPQLLKHRYEAKGPQIATIALDLSSRRNFLSSAGFMQKADGSPVRQIY